MNVNSAEREGQMMPLEFQDFWMGSARAVHDGGFYLVYDLTPEVSRAKFSNGKDWTWDGGNFADHSAAEQACRVHAEKMPPLDAAQTIPDTAQQDAFPAKKG